MKEYHVHVFYKSKYWDSQVWANSVDPDQIAQQCDQGLHSLQFHHMF